MRYILIFLILHFALKSNAQSDTINLSNFRLCELTFDDLKLLDSDIEQIQVEEMNLCPDKFVQDGRFENWIGFKSKLYPGVIFQKYNSNQNTIAKIHLTSEFKGFLPDGNFVNLSSLKAKDIISKYDNLNVWISRGCSDYLQINKNQELYFFVKINKEKEPLYPIDEKYYSEQFINGIDIISNCYSYNNNTSEKEKPLIILEGKEISELEMQYINPEDIESITVLKNENAISKYGQKGKNGVIEIILKRNEI